MAKINVAGELHSIAEDGVLGEAEQIYDYALEKKQSVINAEVKETIENLQNEDEWEEL